MTARVSTIVAAFVSALAVFAVCAAHAAPAPVLRLRLGEDPDTLYNVKTSSLTSSSVLGNFLLERLVYIDDKGMPQPWLAQSWALSDDQRQVTFKLRRGVKFHDGTDFDAAAVKFHFDAIRDPKNASPLIARIGPLSQVEVLNAETVRLTYAKPYAAMFNRFAEAAMGFNSPQAVMRLGPAYGRRPVGTGPYRLVRWIPGAQLELERYDGYRQWRADALNKGPARTERVVAHVIKEEGVASAALETAELSVAALQPDAVEQFRRDKRYRVVTSQTGNLMFIDFNMKREPFDDLRFRQAVSRAIDRQAVVRAAFNGYGNAALGLLSRGTAGYADDVVMRHALPYDPAQARELLTQAGWRPDPARGDGLLYKNGRAARFVLRSYSGFDAIDRTLAVVQSNLKAVGIEIKLETIDWGTLYPSLLKSDWDMVLMRWTATDPSVLSTLFRSPGHRKQLPPDEAVDSVLDRCSVTVQPGPRLRCVAEAQAVLLDRMVAVPVASSLDITAIQEKVQDFNVDALDYLVSGDVRLRP